MANTIEHIQGSQSAYIELKSLLSIARPTRCDIDTLIDHCERQIKLCDKYIDLLLTLQEV